MELLVNQVSSLHGMLGASIPTGMMKQVTHDICNEYDRLRTVVSPGRGELRGQAPWTKNQKWWVKIPTLFLLKCDQPQT